MSFRVHYDSWPPFGAVERYASLCEAFRSLPYQSKLYEMAEKLLQVDVRIIRCFNARATVALAKVILTRLSEIINMKEFPPAGNVQRDNNPLNSNPHSMTMPPPYQLRCVDNIVRECLWLTDFYR